MLSPLGLLDNSPSCKLSDSEFETGKVHAVWFVLFDSASWLESRARPRGPGDSVATSQRHAKLSIQTNPVNRAR